jgi:hypothetical protein
MRCLAITLMICPQPSPYHQHRRRHHRHWHRHLHYLSRCHHHCICHHQFSNYHLPLITRTIVNIIATIIINTTAMTQPA